MIQLPDNYVDPHGLEFGPEAVVVIQSANSSSSENTSIGLGSNGEYVVQNSNTYSRVDYSARIYVSEDAFLEGKKGIPFYNPQRGDFISIENADLSGDLIATCYQHIETLYN
jgi:hypothetical protein